MTERIGLVGCVKTKLPHPAPARSYASPLFRGRRTYVERTCGRWFILSAKLGLVDPDEVVEPYDLALADLTTEERRDWSDRVRASLEATLGGLDGLTFEAHAGSSYLDNGLVVGLQDEGARVERPGEGLGLFDQLAMYAPGERRARPDSTERGAGGHIGGKYEPLMRYLQQRAGPSVELTFDDLKDLVGGLPASAWNHRAWWANDGSHSQARAWLGAGFRVTTVDPRKARVRFERP